MRIFVTVGMSRFPFDRLLHAVAPLCVEHDVFAQTGPSAIPLACASARFLPYEDVLERIARADVVVCHAGNVVRLVQRQGKVPIAAARDASLAEATNDHQREFLRQECEARSVIALSEMQRLPELVARHAVEERRLLRVRRLSAPTDGEVAAGILDEIVADLVDNPFRARRQRRYAYAWSRLHRLRGNHLVLGGSDDFVHALTRTSRLRCYRALPKPWPTIRRLAEPRVRKGETLPFGTGFFSSVSAFDIFGRTSDDEGILDEVARVLAPAGTLVATVRKRTIPLPTTGDSRFAVLDLRDSDRWRLGGVHAVGIPRPWYDGSRGRTRVESTRSGASEVLLSAVRQ